MHLDRFKFETEEHFAENKKFLKRLKQKTPKKLDDQFHELHEEVFEELDCLSCGNCCKTISPIVKESDVDRLAKALRMRPVEVVQNYLRQENDGTYIMNAAPCPFLGEDNYCSVYEHRPKACRDFPHTDRVNMYQLLELTTENLKVCPAVFQIVQRLRQATPDKKSKF